MPNWCVVNGCPNCSKKFDRNGRKLRFFRFPADKKIQEKWRSACRRNEVINVANARICSEHFTNEDYEDELQARLMGTIPIRLKKTAVPTQFLSPVQKKSIKTIPEDIKTKQRKELVEKLLQAGEPDASESMQGPSASTLAECELEDCESEAELAPNADYSVETVIGEATSVDFQVTIATPEMLMQKIRELENENRELLQMVRKAEVAERKRQITVDKLKALEKKNEVMSKRLQTLEGASFSDIDKRVKVMLKDCLSPNQIDIMLKKKTKARWTQEEFSKAFTLRYLSQRAYTYVKETLNYPLPGLSTLRKWASLSQLKSGVLDDVFRIMEISGQSKSPLQRCTVLSFSEMKVASVFEVNEKDDDIIGPHNYMQVIMAQGLFDNWKQPVYVEFDKKITKEILLSVITKLDNIGFSVVACTSNCSGVNQGIWKDFGITMDSTYIGHPVTNEKIHFFADCPSLLKLLRNWFLDTGFMLHGELISKDPVAALISILSNDPNTTSVLTTHHITCEEVHRANFGLAKELFSHSTAIALQQHLPGDRDQAVRVANFIFLVNNWFDLLSVADTNGEIPTKKPYGLDRDAQFQTLEDMVVTMKSIIRVGKNSLQIFQKAVIITCKSLEELFMDMKARHGVDFILTERLNQDCLEKFCALLRTGYVLHEHPSPKIVIKRLRQILLGKTFDGKKTAEVEPDEYLITQTLIQAEIDVPIECTAKHNENSPREKNKCKPVEATKPPPETNQTQFFQQINLVQIDLVDLTKRLMEKYHGRAIEPTKEWYDQVTEMESYFSQFQASILSQPYTDTADVLAQKARDFILQKMGVSRINPQIIEWFVTERMSLPEVFASQHFMSQGMITTGQLVTSSQNLVDSQSLTVNLRCEDPAWETQAEIEIPYATEHDQDSKRCKVTEEFGGCQDSQGILKRALMHGSESELAKRMRPMMETL